MSRTATCLLLVFACAAAACQDEEPKPSAAPPRPAGGGDAEPVGPKHTPAPAAETIDFVLPSVPQLDEDTARAGVEDSVDVTAGDIVTQDALLGLVDRDEAARAVKLARETYLVRGDEDYEDRLAALIGLEVLLAAGEPGAIEETLRLADVILADEEDETSAQLVAALARIGGAERTRAEKLLARIVTLGDDGDEALSAMFVLAERRTTAHLDLMDRTARDLGSLDSLRAAAAGGLVNAGDPRGAKLIAALSGAPDAQLVEVLTGFSVKGATGLLPHVRDTVERAIASGEDAAPEFDAACYAMSDMFAGSDGTPARELINGWLASGPESFEDDAASYALWMLGDDDRADEVRTILVREIASAGGTDVELAVLLLDEIGRRGLAGDERFQDAVEAAAQVEIPGDADPWVAQRLRWLRLAGSNAFLRSQAK